MQDTRSKFLGSAVISPIHEKINYVTADSAYDTNQTYHNLAENFPAADIVISPQKMQLIMKATNFFVIEIFWKLIIMAESAGRNGVTTEGEIIPNWLSNDTNAFLAINCMPENLSVKNKRH